MAALVAAEAPEIASLRDKAERGNSIAQYNLGLAYVNGSDLPKAYVWLTLAEENGMTGKALRSVLAEISPALQTATASN